MRAMNKCDKTGSVSANHYKVELGQYRFADIDIYWYFSSQNIGDIDINTDIIFTAAVFGLFTLKDVQKSD